jgi:hypothetical protein
MLRRELVHGINIEENRFECEPEIIAQIARIDARIYERGISYYGGTYAQGMKIGWRDGLFASYRII